MGKGRGGCDVDTGFLVPDGILDIIEIVLDIIVMAMSGRGWGTSTGWILFIAVIYFLWTLLMFLCFLFKAPDKIGGKQPWLIADLVHNVLATFGYLISFIVAIFLAGFNDVWGILLVIFCLLAFVAYLISMVFCVLEFMGKPVGKK